MIVVIDRIVTLVKMHFDGYKFKMGNDWTVCIKFENNSIEMMNIQP